MSNNEDVEELEPSHTGQVFIVLKSRVEIEQEYEKCSFKALKKFTSPHGDVKLHHCSEKSLSVPQKVKHRVTMLYFIPFTTEYYSILWIYQNLFIHSSADGYLLCRRVL